MNIVKEESEFQVNSQRIIYIGRLLAILQKMCENFCWKLFWTTFIGFQMNQVNSIRVLTLQIMLSLLKMSMYETISTTGLYLPYLSFVSTANHGMVGVRTSS